MKSHKTTHKNVLVIVESSSIANVGRIRIQKNHGKNFGHYQRVGNELHIP